MRFRVESGLVMMTGSGNDDDIMYCDETSKPLLRTVSVMPQGAV